MRRKRGLTVVGYSALWFSLLLLGAAVAAGPVEQGEPGYFRTRISPHVAGVFIEGKYYGTAAMFGHRSMAIELAPGVYEVELLDPRYRPLNAKVTIEPGKTSTLRQVMEPLSYKTTGPLGELKADDFGNAAIYLDGKYYANAQELEGLGRSLLLRPGKYNLKIEPADGTLGREEEIEIRADMTLIVGRLKMRSYEQ